MDDGISIVICCYNSALRLPETLKHLSLQQVESDIKWEIIVVNNASSDDTSTVAVNEWNKLKCSKAELIVVDQLLPGLSYAREKGVCEAKYNYIIFCDDDNWLCDRYIQTAFDILNSDDLIAATGGYGEVVSNIELPDWFAKYAGGYAVGKRGIPSGYMPDYGLLIGAGLAFKKEQYIAAYSKLPTITTDRKGEELSSGGDAEICLRFLMMGFRLYYDESLVFKHFIPKERLTIDYRDKLFEGFGHSIIRLFPFLILVHIKDYKIYKVIFEVLKSVVKIPFSYFKIIKRWNYHQNITYLYLLTGWSFGNINQKCKKVRQTFY